MFVQGKFPLETQQSNLESGILNLEAPVKESTATLSTRTLCAVQALKPEQSLKQVIKLCPRENYYCSRQTSAGPARRYQQLISNDSGWWVAHCVSRCHVALRNDICTPPRHPPVRPGQADLGGCLYVEAGAFPVGQGNQTVYEQLPTQKSLGRLIAQLIDLHQRSQGFARKKKRERAREREWERLP